MWRLFLRPMLVVGIGMTGAACQDDGYAAPRGSYQPAPTGYGNPYYNSGYNSPAPAPSRYGYTTVTVTNRGQNGYRDDVVQQQVVCGSQYYDGYRTRDPLRIIGEVTDWKGHSPEQLKAMKDRLAHLERLGVEAIED